MSMFFSRFAMQICATKLRLWSKLQVCKPDASWYWLPQLCSVSLQPFIPFYPPPNKDPIQAPSILEPSVSFLRIFLWSLVLSFESSFTSTVPNFELFKCAWVTECANTFGDCERRWIRETVCPSKSSRFILFDFLLISKIRLILHYFALYSTVHNLYAGYLWLIWLWCFNVFNFNGLLALNILQTLYLSLGFPLSEENCGFAISHAF